MVSGSFPVYLALTVWLQRDRANGLGYTHCVIVVARFIGRFWRFTAHGVCLLLYEKTAESPENSVSRTKHDIQGHAFIPAQHRDVYRRIWSRRCYDPQQIGVSGHRRTVKIHDDIAL